jgi:hypothetical protein
MPKIPQESINDSVVSLATTLYEDIEGIDRWLRKASAPPEIEQQQLYVNSSEGGALCPYTRGYICCVSTDIVRTWSGSPQWSRGPIDKLKIRSTPTNQQHSAWLDCRQGCVCVLRNYLPIAMHVFKPTGQSIVPRSLSARYTQHLFVRVSGPVIYNHQHKGPSCAGQPGAFQNGVNRDIHRGSDYSTFDQHSTGQGNIRLPSWNTPTTHVHT